MRVSCGVLLLAFECVFRRENAVANAASAVVGVEVAGRRSVASTPHPVARGTEGPVYKVCGRFC